jgi:hypothetical protein
MSLARNLLASAVLLATGCDPVHSAAVAALGGEAPGVRRGPLHRPGQPCELCHDGAFGDPQEFIVAGTIFLRSSGLEGVGEAAVALTDAVGSKYVASTNAAGNFYVVPSEWSPLYPIQSIVVSYTDLSATMYTDIGRQTSCATCHFDPPGANSPGHIALLADDGSAPP